MSNRIRPTSGGRGRAGIALILVALTTGCNYGFQSGTGFVGVETIAILPFENETTRLELTQELYDVMLRNLPRALGLRLAGEDQADIVVRGTIANYQLSTPNYRATGSGQNQRAEVLQRQVTLGVQVEIVDLQENLILWESRSLRAEGQYLEASESEETGKQLALDLLVQRMVDGAQSNW